LYPNVVDVADDDFSHRLALLAWRLEFDDPVTGQRREFVSARSI
jgi:tRNA pseudouridine32 synthase/23S rRNA pseudouridine746 synthase